ncbi:MAG: RagB/SusD family nutrient uptake outer membrane protein [Bacteroidaceae bacterium]|nr:RagB/SusD family nutrient uptake outer membrane protein [Bacteroidaceae bacterium]
MKNIKAFLLAALVGLSFNSCNDFLTLEPLNDIVLENFWTDKSDVESVLLGAYSALESGDCVKSMVVWGETRSDNIVEGNNTPEDIRQICRENLLITNSYCKYNKFYDVVNRANTVLYYAPIVADKDPNYLFSELKANEAEAITLRCLCYWYLIRTFHDVPYVTVPSIDDEGGHEKFYVPQSPFEEILDSIINDLESVKRYAVNKYPESNANTNRITKSAISAMLADMYLWRGKAGDWDKCIKNCEEVTARKMSDWSDLKSKQGKFCTVRSFNGYPLISDAPEEYAGNSYTEIFGEGNSFESLFELPYNRDVSNPFVGDFYQNERSNNVGQLKAFEKIGNDFTISKGNDIFKQSNDSRYYQNLKNRSSSYAITKYAYDEVELLIDGGTIKYDYASIRSNQVPANWIIYRYSEVLLFEAEAYVMKAKQLKVAGPDSLALNDSLRLWKTKAFDLIDAVNKRSIVADNNKVNNQKTLAVVESYNDNSSVEDLETILFQERRRELMFEGKRWYDLVRMARRDGNQDRLIQFVEQKYDASTLGAVKIKLKNPYAMYFPLAKDEVRNSQKVLKQNPAYKDDEKIEQASH